MGGVSRGPTLTYTDICPAGLAGQKQSLLRKRNLMLFGSSLSVVEIKLKVFNLPGGHGTTVCVSQRGSAANQKALSN